MTSDDDNGEVSMKSRRLKFATFAAVALFAAGDALAQSCREEVGADEAQMYVDQCLEVSPATRPPCNAENPCQLIWDEISRGCAMLGNDAPGFCSDY
jgi:hypothetical protein